ncbi:MAG: hypothetical protein VKN72_16270 [Nostocales cyanobacterium 94392]|nr:hypothetical protein [Nostocales cyanobacterium 94392]
MKTCRNAPKVVGALDVLKLYVLAEHSRASNTPYKNFIFIYKHPVRNLSAEQLQL